MTLPETTASRNWREIVLAERAQSERVREEAPEKDFWRRSARRFAPPPPGDQGDDPTLEGLRRLLKPSDTLLDVGAGGGRLAVPLSRHCARVVAVEPSDGMRSQLASAIKEHGAHNIEIVPSTWEKAEVAPADLVLCSHVIYPVAEIEGFVDKLQAHSWRTVVVVLFSRSPLSNYYALWPPIHGEERKRLPSLLEFRAVLESWGIRHKVQKVADGRAQAFADMEEALDVAMQRLFLAPETQKARKLERVLRESLVLDNGSWRFKWAESISASIVSWNVRR